MATNMNLLRAKIVERGTTQERVAEQMGIDASTLSRKIQAQGLSFSIGEMHKLANILQLSSSEASAIFLE